MKKIIDKKKYMRYQNRRMIRSHIAKIAHKYWLKDKRFIDHNKHYKSSILEFCYKNLRGQNISKQKKEKGRVQSIIKIPEKFSFIENPDGVMDVLYSVLKSFFQKKKFNIKIDHSNCTSMDLGASIALDILLLEIHKAQILKRKKISLSGKTPSDTKILNMIRAIGITKTLNIQNQEIHPTHKDNIVFFDMISGYQKNDFLHATHCEKACDKIVNYLNECLNRGEVELTDKGKKRLKELIGEVISNAEDHSGEKRWWALGYMDNSSEIGECYLAIVNLGMSIYDSLHSGLKNEINAMKEVDEIIQHHLKKGWFDPMNKWDEKALWTLLALQDGMSKFKNTEEGVDRGTGTVKMIEWFQKICDSKNPKMNPRMSLISGSSQIMFNEKYLIKSENFGQEKRKIIAFNKTNSLKEKPDRDNVKAIANYFPGTVISMRCYIDKEYFKEKI